MLFYLRSAPIFYPLASLNGDERSALLAALESMSPESIEYKGLKGKMEMLKEKLKG